MRALLVIVLAALCWPVTAGAADAVPDSAAPAFDPAFAAAGGKATALFATGSAVRVADGTAAAWAAPASLATAPAAARPLLAADSTGAAVAVWRDGSGWRAARRAATGAWAAMTNVPAIGTVTPRVAIGGGIAVIAYDGPGGVVWSARAAAAAWSAPAAVTGGSTPERLDDVTVSSTGVGYLLLAEASAPPVLKVADDGGDPGWGVPLPLAGATPDLANDAPGRLGALAGGAVVAVWTDAQRDPDAGDVLARSVRGWIHPAGGDWSGSNFLHSVADPAATHVSDLALATDGAEAVVAAWTVGGMVMAARATRTGSWVFEDVVLADGAVAAPAVAAGPGGTLAAAWQQDGTQVWGAVAPDGTGPWGAAARLDDAAAGGAGPPQAASGAGLLFGWRTLGAAPGVRSAWLAPSGDGGTADPPPGDGDPPPDDGDDGGGGTSAPPPVVVALPPTPPPALVTPEPLRDLTVTCRKRRGKPCRVRVAFAVDRAARATLVFARLKRGDAKRLGKITAQVQPPGARIDVAKVGGKAIAPGRYRITITLPGVRRGVARVRVS